MGDSIAIVCVLALLGVVIRAVVMERRERRRREDRERLGLGGRGVRR